MLNRTRLHLTTLERRETPSPTQLPHEMGGKIEIVRIDRDQFSQDIKGTDKFALIETMPGTSTVTHIAVGSVAVEADLASPSPTELRAPVSENLDAPAMELASTAVAYAVN